VEQTVDLQLRKVDLQQLAEFLKRVETGPNLVYVNRLQIRTRFNEHENLDVELSVAGLERAPEQPKRPGTPSPSGAGAPPAGTQGRERAAEE
jgi:hypothetical protein